MAKNQRRSESPAERPAPVKTSSVAPGNVVLIAAVCLGIGVFTGYYFGTQSAQPTVSSIPVQETGTILNPAAFAQDEAALRTALRANPNDLNTMVQLGNLYYDHGRFKDAVDWYGRALDVNPNDVNVRTDRGTSYWNLGQADAAIAEFRKALSVNPSHAQTLYNLGVVLLNGKNDAQEARKTWELLLASNPDYPDRAKLLQQLATLPGASTAPSGSPSVAGQKAGSGGVEDLLERMKMRR
jgi:cytochrome c-type biogenesis protein CcmH/NrfG